jgi:hypothetical protein
MSEKKPTPMIRDANSKICPVCGKQSYSRDGIHPQCAMNQADAPRRLRLAVERKQRDQAKDGVQSGA